MLYGRAASAEHIPDRSAHRKEMRSTDKVNDIGVLCAGYANEEVVGLDVAVDKVARVNVFNAGDLGGSVSAGAVAQRASIW